MINTQTNVGRLTGVALTLLTVCFAGYALFKYFQRLTGLKTVKNAAGLDDKIGPPILIGAFCAVLIVIAAYFASQGF